MVRKFGKKKISHGLRFVFDLSDVVYKEEHEPQIDLSRWFNFDEVNNYYYDFVVNWGDYRSKTRVTTHRNEQGQNSGFDVWELENGQWIQTQFAVERLNLSHLYTRRNNVSLVRVGNVGQIMIWDEDQLREPYEGELDSFENIIERMFLDYDDFSPIEKMEGVFNVSFEGYELSQIVDGETIMEYHECLCPRLDGYDAPVHDSITDSLTTALVPYCAESPLTEARGLFNNCWRFRRVDGSLFKYCTEATDMSRLFRNTRIDFVPVYIFRHCVALENVTEMFEGSQLKMIPASLFNDCPNLRIIDRLLHRCAAILEIPEDLFANNSRLYSARGAFKFMPQCLDIPFGLLRDKYHTELYDVYEIFCGGVDEIDPAWCFADDGIKVVTFEVGSEQAVVSFMPELWTWERFKDFSFFDTCYNYWGCNHAINIIPETWKLSVDKPQGYLYEDYETIYYINNFILPEGYTFKEYVTLHGDDVYEYLVDQNGVKRKSIDSRNNVSENDEYAIDVDVSNQVDDNRTSGAGALYKSNSNEAAYIALIPGQKVEMKSGAGNKIQTTTKMFDGHMVWNISKRGISIGQGQGSILWSNSPIVSNNSKWHFVSLQEGGGASSYYALSNRFYGGYLKTNGNYSIKLYPCVDEQGDEYLYESIGQMLYKIESVSDYFLNAILYQLLDDDRFKTEESINQLLGDDYRYEERLWIYNNGQIDTGRILNENDEYYFEFKAFNNGGSGGNGSSAGDSANSFTYIVVQNYNQRTCRCRIGSGGDVGNIQYNNSEAHYENTLFKITNNTYPVSFFNRRKSDERYEMILPEGLKGRTFQTSTGERHWRFGAISGNGSQGNYMRCHFYGGMIRGNGFNKVYIPTMQVSTNTPAIVVYDLDDDSKSVYQGLSSNQIQKVESNDILLFHLLNDDRFKNYESINQLLGGDYVYMHRLLIQNNGHIDTGRIVNENDEYYFEFTALNNGGTGGNGSSGGDSANSFTYMVVQDFNQRTCRCRIGSGSDLRDIQYNNSEVHCENTLFKIKNDTYPVTFYNWNKTNNECEMIQPEGLKGRSFKTSDGGRHWRFGAISNSSSQDSYMKCHFYGGMIRGEGFNKVYIPTLRVSDSMPSVVVYDLDNDSMSVYQGLSSNQLSLD